MIQTDTGTKSKLIRNSEMNTDQDGPPYCIEDTLLLKFLITRFTEMLGMDEPRLVPVWEGLGMVALHQNRELEHAFKTLISSDSYTAEEILTSSIDLFLAELIRLGAIDTTDYPGKKVELRPMSPGTARKFLYWSWGEGRKMVKEQCFEFYSIWELVSWLGLTSDEYIKEFEERCRFSAFPVGVKLEEGLEVVKAAIFNRPIENTSFQPDPLKTGITRIDLEANK